MKHAGLMALLLVVLASAGCSNQPVREGTDLKKAADYNAQLGLRYMQQGRNELALDKLNKAIQQDPDSAAAHHYLAELYRRLGEHDKAEDAYREALDLEPDNSSLHNNFGVYLCGRKRMDEAEEEFLKVLQNPVYHARDQVYENMGTCLYEKPDLKKAEDYLRKALQLNPKRPQALLTLAEISYGQKNYISARAFLQRFSEVSQPSPKSLWLRIRTERILGDRDAVASSAMLLKGKYPAAEETRLYLESVQK